MTKHTHKPTKKSHLVFANWNQRSHFMQGGVNPALPFAWYTDLPAASSREHPTNNLDCFSPIEIEDLLMFVNENKEVLCSPKEAGAWTSRGAEMLVEKVRKDAAQKRSTCELVAGDE